MTSPPSRKPGPSGKGLLPLLAIAAPVLAFIGVAMHNASDGARPEPLPTETTEPAEAAPSDAAAEQQGQEQGQEQKQASGLASLFGITWPWERDAGAQPDAASASAEPSRAPDKADDHPRPRPTPSPSPTETASADQSPVPDASAAASDQPGPQPSRQCREVCTGGTTTAARQERATPMRYLGDTHFNLNGGTAQAAGKQFADQKCGGRAREMRVVQDECSGDVCFIRVSASCASTAQPRPAEPRRCRQVCT